MEPLTIGLLAGSIFAGLTGASVAALKGWQGWLELKRFELTHRPATARFRPPATGSRSPTFGSVSASSKRSPQASISKPPGRSLSPASGEAARPPLEPGRLTFQDDQKPRRAVRRMSRPAIGAKSLSRLVLPPRIDVEEVVRRERKRQRRIGGEGVPVERGVDERVARRVGLERRRPVMIERMLDLQPPVDRAATAFHRAEDAQRRDQRRRARNPSPWHGRHPPGFRPST